MSRRVNPANGLYDELSTEKNTNLKSVSGYMVDHEGRAMGVYWVECY